MKISYVSVFNALDIKSWSGTVYYMAKALETQNAQMDYIGDLKKNLTIPLKMKIGLLKLFYNAGGKNFDYERDLSTAKQFADQIKTSLKPGTDIIFSSGCTQLSMLKTKIPKVFYADATFAGLIDFYDHYSNLCSDNIKYGNYLQQNALDSSALAIYSSDWAARTAIENYKVNPEKVKVVPFGANIEYNRNLDDIRKIVESRPSKECNLLFLGVEWHRKGGDTALRVAEILNAQGLKTKLHVAGIEKIQADPLPDFVINHGFISKTTQEGRNQIDKLISESHFLIVPSRAEAYGIVFCEANSFGVPCITTNVGGIPTIIKDDINGKVFSLNDTEESFAAYIYTVFNNQQLYRQMAYSSFNEFETRLNWNVAGKTIMSLLKAI